MTGKQLANMALKIVEMPTYYVMGGFGQRLITKNGEPVDWYNRDYEYNKKHKNEIEAHTNQNPVVFAFDCICLIKSIAWSFQGSPALPFGGAKYESNGIPDMSISKLAASCPKRSTDFTNIDIGEIVFLGTSHVGIYVGDGHVVESTPAWKNGVQLTLLPDLLNPDKLPVRKWDWHGKPSYFTYTNYQPIVDTWESAYKILSDKFDALNRECNTLKDECTRLTVAINKIREVIKNV